MFCFILHFYSLHFVTRVVWLRLGFVHAGAVFEARPPLLAMCRVGGRGHATAVTFTFVGQTAATEALQETGKERHAR